MPRPISPARVPPWLLVAVFLVAWVIWCVFSVQTLVPFVERHLVIYYGLAAWFLCILPVLGTGIFVLVRAGREES